MADEQQPIVDPVRPFVANQIREQGLGPFEAINWGHDRQIAEMFRAAVMFTRLCGDPVERIHPRHAELHALYRVQACVGPELIRATQISLGISDARAQHLLNQLDHEHRIVEGLKGTGGAD